MIVLILYFLELPNQSGCCRNSMNCLNCSDHWWNRRLCYSNCHQYSLAAGQKQGGGGLLPRVCTSSCAVSWWIATPFL